VEEVAACCDYRAAALASSMRIIGPDPLSVITTGWGTNPVTALSWVALIRVTLMTAKKTPRLPELDVS